MFSSKLIVYSDELNNEIYFIAHQMIGYHFYEIKCGILIAWLITTSIITSIAINYSAYCNLDRYEF